MLLVGCSKPQGTGDPTTTGTGVTTPAGTGTTDSGDTGTTTSTTEPFDCSTIPALPATWQTFTEYGRAEDFDFDGDGYMVAVINGTLAGRNQSGDVKVIAGGMGAWPAGTRVLPTGDFIVANTATGALNRVETASGGIEPIATGMSYPNGVEVDADNNVYAADQDLGIVVRVNAYDPNDREIIARDLVSPNGVILSADDSRLYVGSFGGGVVYEIPRDGNGGWEPARELVRNPGYDGGFDGINTDICGNIYITEYLAGRVWRISSDGQDLQLVANLPSGWIPNLRWGHDIGGWSREVLYVSDRYGGRLFGLELGVPGKPHVLAP